MVKLGNQVQSKYRKLGLIGQGQFGKVFCGVDRKTGEIFALKDLSNRFPTLQFLRELRILFTLRHPNITTCQGLEHHPTGRYLVMDYCEGGTLKDFIESDFELSLVHKLEIIIDVLHGLEYAHRRGIIHCDIKPENILLTLENNAWIAKITDFGVAKILQEINKGVTGLGDTGSPAYMAPERYYGQYSFASDLYAIGIILYELIVGDRPFHGLPKEMMLAHLNQPVIIPDSVPVLIRSIIQTSLQKLPNKRYSSTSEMLQAVETTCAVYRANYRQSPLLLSPTSPPVTTPVIIDQETLNYPYYFLNYDHYSLYLASQNTVECRLKDQSFCVLLEEDILDLKPYNNGHLIITDNHLYTLPFKETKIQAQYNAKDSLTTLDFNGYWLAVSQSYHSTIELLRLPSLTRLSSLPLKDFPSQMIAINQRYGVILIDRGQTTEIKIFTRKGRWIWSNSVSLKFHDIIICSDIKNRLFALEKSHYPLGIIIDLFPFKMRRIPLSIFPDFLISTLFGYILANRQGTVIILDQEGHQLGQFQVDENQEITAITTDHQYHLWVATWESSQKQGKLSEIDILQTCF